MHKLKLYLETTTFNYFFDDREFHDDTVQLFESIGRGEFEAYTSEYVTVELRNASEPKRSYMLNLIDKYGIVTLTFNTEAEQLANLYIDSGVIPEKYRLDATHIAIASVHNLDCVLSFNFQHINKLKTKRMTENINLTEGYKGVTICTPMEVL